MGAVIYKQQCQVRSEIKRVGFYSSTYTGAGSADGTTDADCSDLAVVVTSVGANAASYQKYAITAGGGCDLSKFDVGEQLTIECASSTCNNDGKIVTVTNNDPEGNSLTCSQAPATPLPPSMARAAPTRLATAPTRSWRTPARPRCS